MRPRTYQPPPAALQALLEQQHQQQLLLKAAAAGKLRRPTAVRAVTAGELAALFAPSSSGAAGAVPAPEALPEDSELRLPGTVASLGGIPPTDLVLAALGSVPLQSPASPPLLQSATVAARHSVVDASWVRGFHPAVAVSLLRSGGGGADPVPACNTLLDAYAVRGQWRAALSTLYHMREAGLAPTPVSFSLAIAALCRGDAIAEAERVFELLPPSVLHGDAGACVVAMAQGYAEAGLFERARPLAAWLQQQAGAPGAGIAAGTIEAVEAAVLVAAGVAGQVDLAAALVAAAATAELNGASPSAAGSSTTFGISRLNSASIIALLAACARAGAAAKAQALLALLVDGDAEHAMAVDAAATEDPTGVPTLLTSVKAAGTLLSRHRAEFLEAQSRRAAAAPSSPNPRASSTRPLQRPWSYLDGYGVSTVSSSAQPRSPLPAGGEDLPPYPSPSQALESDSLFAVLLQLQERRRPMAAQLVASPASYVHCIEALAAAGQFESAVALLRVLRARCVQDLRRLNSAATLSFVQAAAAGGGSKGASGARSSFFNASPGSSGGPELASALASASLTPVVAAPSGGIGATRADGGVWRVPATAYDALLLSPAASGNMAHAAAVLRLMAEADVAPTAKTFTLLLRSCAQSSALPAANALFAAAQSSAAAESPELYAGLMEAMASSGQRAAAASAAALRAGMLADAAAGVSAAAVLGLQELQPNASVYAALALCAGAASGAEAVAEIAFEAAVGAVLSERLYAALPRALATSVGRGFSASAAAAAAGASAVLGLVSADSLRLYQRVPAVGTVARLLGDAGRLPEALDLLRDAGVASAASCPSSGGGSGAVSTAAVYVDLMTFAVARSSSSGGLAAVDTAAVPGGAAGSEEPVPPAAVSRAMESDAVLLLALQHGSNVLPRVDASLKEEALEEAIVAAVAGGVANSSLPLPSERRAAEVLEAVLRCHELLLRHIAASGSVAAAADVYADALRLQRSLWPGPTRSFMAVARARAAAACAPGSSAARRAKAVAGASAPVCAVHAAWLDVLSDGRAAGPASFDRCVGVFSDLAADGLGPTPGLLVAGIRAVVASRRPDLSEAVVAHAVAAARTASQSHRSLLGSSAIPAQVAAYAALLCFDDEVVVSRLHAASCVPAAGAVLAIWGGYVAFKAAALADMRSGAALPELRDTLRDASPLALVTRRVLGAYVSACSACARPPDGSVPALDVDAWREAAIARPPGGAAGPANLAAEAFTLDAALAAARAAVCECAAAWVAPDLTTLAAVAQLYVRTGLVADARLLLRQAVLPALVGVEYNASRLQQDVQADTLALLAVLAPAAGEPERLAGTCRITFDDAALLKLGVSSAGLAFGGGHWLESSASTGDSAAAVVTAPALYVASVVGSRSRGAGGAALLPGSNNSSSAAATPGILAGSSDSFWSKEALCAVVLALGAAGCSAEVDAAVQAAWEHQLHEATAAAAAASPDATAATSSSGAPPVVLLDRSLLACVYAARVACGDVGRADAALLDARFSATDGGAAAGKFNAFELSAPRQFSALISTLRVVGCCASGRVHEAVRLLEVLVAEHVTSSSHSGGNTQPPLPFFAEAVSAAIEAAAALSQRQLTAVPSDDAPASAAMMPYLKARALLGGAEQPSSSARGAVAADPRGAPAQPSLGSLVPSAASVIERLEAIASVLTGGSASVAALGTAPSASSPLRSRAGGGGAASAADDAVAAIVLRATTGRIGGAPLPSSSVSSPPVAWLPSLEDLAALSRLYARLPLAAPLAAVAFACVACDAALDAAEVPRQGPITLDSPAIAAGGGAGVVTKSGLQQFTVPAARGVASATAAVSAVPLASRLARWGLHGLGATGTSGVEGSGGDPCATAQSVLDRWGASGLVGGGSRGGAAPPALVPAAALLEALLWALASAPAPLYSSEQLGPEAVRAVVVAASRLRVDASDSMKRFLAAVHSRVEHAGGLVDAAADSYDSELRADVSAAEDDYSALPRGGVDSRSQADAVIAEYLIADGERQQRRLRPGVRWPLRLGSPAAVLHRLSWVLLPQPAPGGAALPDVAATSPVPSGGRLSAASLQSLLASAGFQVSVRPRAALPHVVRVWDRAAAVQQRPARPSPFALTAVRALCGVAFQRAVGRPAAASAAVLSSAASGQALAGGSTESSSSSRALLRLTDSAAPPSSHGGNGSAPRAVALRPSGGVGGFDSGGTLPPSGADATAEELQRLSNEVLVLHLELQHLAEAADACAAERLRLEAEEAAALGESQQQQRSPAAGPAVAAVAASVSSATHGATLALPSAAPPPPSAAQEAGLGVRLSALHAALDGLRRDEDVAAQRLSLRGGPRQLFLAYSDAARRLAALEEEARAALAQAEERTLLLERDAEESARRLAEVEARLGDIAAAEVPVSSLQLQFDEAATGGGAVASPRSTLGTGRLAALAAMREADALRPLVTGPAALAVLAVQTSRLSRETVSAARSNRDAALEAARAARATADSLLRRVEEALASRRAQAALLGDLLAGLAADHASAASLLHSAQAQLDELRLRAATALELRAANGGDVFFDASARLARARLQLEAARTRSVLDRRAALAARLEEAVAGVRRDGEVEAASVRAAAARECERITAEYRRKSELAGTTLAATIEGELRPLRSGAAAEVEAGIQQRAALAAELATAEAELEAVAGQTAALARRQQEAYDHATAAPWPVDSAGNDVRDTLLVLSGDVMAGRPELVALLQEVEGWLEDAAFGGVTASDADADLLPPSAFVGMLPLYEAEARRLAALGGGGAFVLPAASGRPVAALSPQLQQTPQPRSNVTATPTPSGTASPFSGLERRGPASPADGDNVRALVLARLRGRA